MRRQALIPPSYSFSVSFARLPRRQTEPVSRSVRPQPCVLAAVRPPEAITRATSRRQLALRTHARTPSLFYQPSSGRPPCTLLTRRQLLSQHLLFSVPGSRGATPSRLAPALAPAYTHTHTHSLSLSLSQSPHVPHRTTTPRTRRA